MHVEGRRSRGGKEKNIGAVFNMVLICVILDGFIFKYKVHKMRGKKVKA